MPHLIGIGAQKAGTTWLYEQLRQHPQISFPGGKEVHYWDRLQAGDRPYTASDYLNLLGSPMGADNYVADITPAYAMLSSEWVQRLYNELPQARLIFCLRNPMERAWSSARMALTRAELEPQDVNDDWYITHFNSRGSRARGDYLATLQNWLSHYSRDQFLITDFSELKQSPITLLAKVFQHLDLPMTQQANFDALNAPVFKGLHLEMSPRIRRALWDIYAHSIEELASFVGLDFGDWREGFEY